MASHVDPPDECLLRALTRSVRHVGNAGTSGRAPGAGLLSLAFFVLAGVWTKARGLLVR